MKMRFTDIDKWKKMWFRNCGAEAKLAWLWLCDNCDDAGVIEADHLRMSFDIFISPSEVSAGLEQLIELEKLQRLGDRHYFIPSFIGFQYPKGLKENYNPHKSVFRALRRAEKYNPDLATLRSRIEGLPNPSMNKDKDRIKDKFWIRIKSIWERRTRGIISPQLLITDRRKQAIMARKNDFGIRSVFKAWTKAAESDFLTNRHGLNRNNFKATFDWIHNPNNFVKILEGNYDNKEVADGRSGF